MNPNIPSTAAANVLSGEKSFQTVTFAVTGDPETDLISAVVACVNGLVGQQSYESAYQIACRVLSYLAKRYGEGYSAFQKMQEALAKSQPQFPPQSYQWNLPPNSGIGNLQGISGLGAQTSGGDMHGVRGFGQ